MPGPRWGYGVYLKEKRGGGVGPVGSKVRKNTKSLDGGAGGKKKVAIKVHGRREKGKTGLSPGRDPGAMLIAEKRGGSTFILFIGAKKKKKRKRAFGPQAAQTKAPPIEEKKRNLICSCG